MELNHRDQLPEFLRYLNLNNKGVELGTFNGSFSKHLISNWSGILYMVDVWRPLSFDEYDDSSNHAINQDAYKNAMDNIKGFEDRAFMLRMKGEFACDLFQDNSLDFVYIDANHTYDAVKEDIKNWYPKVKSGGLVMGHDYLPNDMYSDGSKDLPIYLFDDSVPEGSKYAGMFGVNPAVNEFAKENLYTVGRTEEWLGTWWFIKK